MSETKLDVETNNHVICTQMNCSIIAPCYVHTDELQYYRTEHCKCVVDNNNNN